MDLPVKIQLLVSCWPCDEHCAKQQNLKQPSPPSSPQKAALYLQASRVPELQCGSQSRQKAAGPEVSDVLGVGVGVRAGHRSLSLLSSI